MNEQELDEKIEEIIQNARMNGCGQRHLDEIKSLCFQARDMWVLGEIEKLGGYHMTLPHESGFIVANVKALDDIRKVFEKVLNTKDVLGTDQT